MSPVNGFKHTDPPLTCHQWTYGLDGANSHLLFGGLEESSVQFHEIIDRALTT